MLKNWSTKIYESNVSSLYKNSEKTLQKLKIECYLFAGISMLALAAGSYYAILGEYINVVFILFSFLCFFYSLSVADAFQSLSKLEVGT